MDKEQGEELLRNDDERLVFKSTKDLLHRTIQYFETKFYQSQQETASIQGIQTGLVDLDKVTDGLSPGVIVVGARPEDGLTDFGLTIAHNIAHTHPVAYLTPNLSAEMLMKRLMHIDSGLNIRNTLDGFLADRDACKLTASAGRLLEKRLHWYEGKMDSYRFVKVCETTQELHGTKVVILDRFQSLFPYESSGESFYWKAREIAGLFHDLVSERGLTLLVLSEVKKKSRNERLSTSHLRDFGVFEYDAKPVILLERAEFDDEDYYTQHDAISISANITNNYAGQMTVQVPLVYLHSTGKFESAARINLDEPAYTYD